MRQKRTRVVYCSYVNNNPDVSFEIIGIKNNSLVVNYKTVANIRPGKSTTSLIVVSDTYPKAERPVKR